ncbi:MAG TPA: DUF4058 family protein [Pirellulaceae bacterium]|nr:DUF4058 family protein [Pirellulaceae bacterium]
MPSPFPGFDPYLEAPDIWPDFHYALAADLRNELNRVLPRPYYARLEMRPEIGFLEEAPVVRRVVPDVTVVKGAGAARESAVALADGPRTVVSQSVDVTVNVEPIRHSFVEILDSSRKHHLITVIEIVSPTNKRPGQDRRAYEHKQRENLDSDVSLVELDLLRSGERLCPYPALAQIVAELSPHPDYLVSVNRWWQRMGDAMDCQLFPTTIRESLPCIPIPLRREEAEPTLDLQWHFNRVYDSGPYWRGAIDYSRPPDPPLPPEDAAWAAELVGHFLAI